MTTRRGRRSVPSEDPGRTLRADRPAKDPDAFNDERPAHRVRLPRFFIARYPVTVAQWRVYYEAADAATRKTLDPRSLEGPTNHPVVWVSWYDALGYCQWLTRELRARAWEEMAQPGATRTVPEPLATLLLRGDGTSSPWVVTLPSEAEWEKAARGTDGRRYPWGNEWDNNRANVWKTGIKAVSAVGCFGGGTSQAGTEDQSGNVWEWTRSLWGPRIEEPDFKYPYEHSPRAERENLRAPDNVHRVVRGGTLSFPGGVRSASRFGGRPTARDDGVGFRVVVFPFSS